MGIFQSRVSEADLGMSRHIWWTTAQKIEGFLSMLIIAGATIWFVSSTITAVNNLRETTLCVNCTVEFLPTSGRVSITPDASVEWQAQVLTPPLEGIEHGQIYRSADHPN